jgi:hypothetical protein
MPVEHAARQPEQRYRQHFENRVGRPDAISFG